MRILKLPPKFWIKDHSVTELNDVTGAGSGIIISDAERKQINNPPNCVVYNSAEQTVSNATETVKEFDTVVLDNASMADTTNNRINIPEAGTYLCLGGVVADGTIPDGDISEVYFKVNGNRPEASSLSVGDGAYSAGTSCIVVYCAVGDYIELYIFQNTGNDLKYFNTYYNGIMVKRII